MQNSILNVQQPYQPVGIPLSRSPSPFPASFGTPNAETETQYVISQLRRQVALLRAEKDQCLAEYKALSNVRSRLSCALKNSIWNFNVARYFVHHALSRATTHEIDPLAIEDLQPHLETVRRHVDLYMDGVLSTIRELFRPEEIPFEDYSTWAQQISRDAFGDFGLGRPHFVPPAAVMSTIKAGKEKSTITRTSETIPQSLTEVASSFEYSSPHSSKRNMQSARTVPRRQVGMEGPPAPKKTPPERVEVGKRSEKTVQQGPAKHSRSLPTTPFGLGQPTPHTQSEGKARTPIALPPPAGTILLSNLPKAWICSGHQHEPQINGGDYSNCRKCKQRRRATAIELPYALKPTNRNLGNGKATPKNPAGKRLNETPRNLGRPKKKVKQMPSSEVDNRSPGVSSRSMSTDAHNASTSDFKRAMERRRRRAERDGVTFAEIDSLGSEDYESSVFSE